MSQHYPMREFFLDLGRRNLEVFRHDKKERLVAFGESEEHSLGCIFTPKGQASILSFVEDESGKRRPVVSATPEQYDFSFVALNWETGAGLLSSYSGSGGFADVCGILRNRYNLLLHEKRDQLLEELKDRDELTNKKKTILHSRFKHGQFEMSRLIKREDWEKLLRKLSTISGVEYEEPKPARQSRYSSIRNAVRTEKRILRLTGKKNIAKEVAGWAVDFVQKNGITKMKVRGTYSNGKAAPPIELHPTVASLANFDYNRVVSSTVIDADKVEDAAFFQNMITAMRTEPALFYSPHEG